MANLFPKKLHKHFWDEESGLTSIFVLLCLTNFLVFPFFPRLQILIRIFWFALLLAGISTLAKNKSQRRIYSVIPVLLIVVSAAQYLIPDSTFLGFIGLGVEILVFALLIGMVLVKVFEDGKVTIHRIIGSIVVYMLIANIWAIIYSFLYLQLPGSIQIPSVLTEEGVASSIFLYFSYTTLSTTGYGDILPVHSLVRTLVIIEQLIGVLYPVILIGRLVSLVVGNPGTSEEGKN
jgi:hypothetical protein